MLVKQQRYKFRLEAVKKPATEPPHIQPAATKSTSIPVGALGNDRMKRPERATELWAADGLANPGDVWTIPSQPRSENHFAAFPDKLVRRCILASTDEGDEVLDPFVGRGTTVIVAKQLGRSGLGIELNPEYAELARENIRREASQEVLTPQQED